MTDTASMRIYRIRDDISLNHVITHITENKHYFRLEFHQDGLLIQERQAVEIHAFSRQNPTYPDWVGMISPYILNKNSLDGFLRFDFVMLVQCKSTMGQSYIFALCSGSGYIHIADLIDYSFGITILESVFDPEVNKIISVAERGIIGDVLASQRFYRRARPVAYEDNFGKYYQNINVPFRDTQFRRYFPILANYKGNKLRPRLSFAGSSSVDIRMKLSFFELILLIKDLAELMNLEAPHVFNRNLKPLDSRRDKEEITTLDELIFNSLVDYCFNPDDRSVDFDFCHREFEAFFTSDTCQFNISGLVNLRGEDVEPLVFEDVHELGDLSWVSILFNLIKNTVEYQRAENPREFVTNQLKSIKIETRDEQGNITTSGKLKEYLQEEVSLDGTSYFLMDDKWYILQAEFDTMLSEHYLAKISNNFKDYNFIQIWGNHDEHTYNALYDNQPISFCLHPLKVEHVELCDILLLDSENKRVRFLYVKDGIGATIRDLTSQAYMAARIIEEEARSPAKVKLKKLYEQAVRARKINNRIISEEEFLTKISSFHREYILVIHGHDSARDIKEGNFESRIAKYSLVEFASLMRTYDWDFSLCTANR